MKTRIISHPDSLGLPFRSRTMETATRLVDFLYDSVNPRLSEWQLEWQPGDSEGWAWSGRRDYDLVIEQESPGFFRLYLEEDDGAGSYQLHTPPATRVAVEWFV